MGRLVRGGVGRCIRRLAREERGNALTIFAVVAPLFILFLALALDVGNWYAQKRQLQNRADAGALAAGVEYQDRLTGCLGTDPTAKSAAATAITLAARNFAGAAYNAGNPQGPVSVAVNGNDFGTADFSDGGTPCDTRTVSDWISTAPTQWADVKVKETNIPTLFGSFGVPVPAITARARVDLHPAESDNQFIPLGIPDPVIYKAQARFFNACLSPGTTGYYLNLTNGTNKVTLTELADQTGAPALTTLWAPTGGGSIGIAQGQINTTCLGAGTNGWIPIGVEVRLGGLPGVDIDTPSCSTLHQETTASRYADCYTDPAMIRAFAAPGASGTIPPVFKDVHLYNGAPQCKYDPHFTTATSPACSFGGSVDVDWDGRPGQPGDGFATYQVSLNGVPLSSATKNLWSVGSGLSPGANGTQDVSVSWHWEDTNPAHTFNGASCNSQGNNPCKGSGGPVVVQRAFAGTDDTTGIIRLLQLTSSGVGPGASLMDSSPRDAILPFNLYVGLQAVFKPDTSVTSALTTLRQDTSQGNQSLNCNTQQQGDDFQEYANGCSLFYSSNEAALTDTPATPVTNNPWWQGTPHGCPDGTAIWGIANTPSDPYLCVATAPGSSVNTIACAMAFRTGNWVGGPPNNNCGPNDLGCVHPNKYADFVSSGGTAGDPRVVKVFVVPFGAFKGVNGASNDAAVPIYDFGAFYITGWGGQGNKVDPCPTSGPNPEDPAQPNEIVGHFVKWAGPNVGPVDPNQECTLSQLRPCRPTLVR